MQPFDYYRPKTLSEAFDILGTPGKVTLPVAGGTDFIPLHRDGVWKLDAVVDIKAVEGMRDLRETPEGLYVGAAVRMTELARSDLVRSRWDVLAQAASVVGSDQIRNRATVGGNLCTASPCADTPPALCVLDGLVILKGPAGERRVPVQDFFVFVRKTVLQKGELVCGILLPQPAKGSVGIYEKLSRRKGCDLSLVSVAALAKPVDRGLEWRIALGAVAPTVMRATDAEALLAKGHDEKTIIAAAEAAAEQSKPISDVRASESYRKTMVRNIAIRAIKNVLAKMG